MPARKTTPSLKTVRILPPLQQTEEAAALFRIEHASEQRQIVFVDIGDRPDRHPVTRPMPFVESANGSRVASTRVVGRRPNEHIDEVESASVHQGGGGPALDAVDAAALEHEPVVSKIGDRRRKIQLALKPWLHGVLIR